MPQLDILSVIEVFWQNHFEPWAIIDAKNQDEYEKALATAIMAAEWQLKPLRYRESNIRHWGGVEQCIKRMKKVFGHRNN